MVLPADWLREKAKSLLAKRRVQRSLHPSSCESRGTLKSPAPVRWSPLVGFKTAQIRVLVLSLTEVFVKVIGNPPNPPNPPNQTLFGAFAMDSELLLLIMLRHKRSTMILTEQELPAMRNERFWPDGG